MDTTETDEKFVEKGGGANAEIGLRAHPWQ